MRVGVLALQGDVPEHVQALTGILPADSIRAVRRPADLEGIVALFLPGGESTTIGRLLTDTGIRAPLIERIRHGLPVLATCAGLILLAETVEPSPGGRDPEPLGVLDIVVRRNDYGNQRDSFEGPVDVTGLDAPFPGVFIRAPRILQTGSAVQVIGRWQDQIVGVRQGPLWGLSFHPELSADGRLHALFLAETLGFGQRSAHPSTHRTTARSRTRPAATASQ